MNKLYVNIYINDTISFILTISFVCEHQQSVQAGKKRQVNSRKMADHFTKDSKKILKWWPCLLLICNFLLIQFVNGTPIQPLQLPDYPQQIHYVGDRPLPGGHLQSLLNGNYTPDQIVTGSGVPTNPAFTGTAGGFSFLGNAIGKVGNALGSALGSAVKGTHILLTFSHIMNICIDEKKEELFHSIENFEFNSFSGVVGAASILLR